MSYLNKNASYYEGDKQRGDVDCQKRPVGDYKLISAPLSDPMNCWVPKVQADFDKEKEAQAEAMITPEIERLLEFLRQSVPVIGVALPDQAVARSALKDFYIANQP